MKTLANRILAIAIIPVCLAGCFDRDREMINRKSDGTDTFKYKPPVQHPVSPESSMPREAKTVEKASADPSSPNATGRRDNAQKFKYKPDPRLLKQMKNDKSK